MIVLKNGRLIDGTGAAPVNGATIVIRDNRIDAVTQRSEGDWPVGVLYSRSGATSVTESEHFFGTVLAVEEINAAGGVLGRLLAPVAYDPRGDPDEYRKLVTRMLLDDDINVIFGCSRSSRDTSPASRKEREVSGTIPSFFTRHSALSPTLEKARVMTSQ